MKKHNIVNDIFNIKNIYNPEVSKLKDKTSTAFFIDFFKKNSSLIARGNSDADNLGVNRIEYLGTFEVPGKISKIFIKDNIAYISYSFRDLLLLDLKDKKNPFKLSSCRPGGNLMDFFVCNNYIYMTCLPAGVKLVDISDNTNPYIRYWSLSDIFMPGIFIYRKYLYGFTPGNFQVLKFSNVDNLKLISKINLNCRRMRQITFSDNCVFVLSGKLTVIDIRNKKNPFIKAEFDAGNIRNIIIKKSLLYSLDYGGLLTISDISDINNKKLLGSIQTSSSAQSLFIYNNYAFIANKTSISMLDISNPAKPLFLLSLFGHYIYLEDNIAYIANNRTFMIMDIKNLIILKKN